MVTSKLIYNFDMEKIDTNVSLHIEQRKKANGTSD